MDIEIFILTNQMLNYYLKLYIVNPHLFGSREVIEQNFCSGFPSKEYLHYESVLLLNLCDHRHQRFYRIALGMNSESLRFLLQNGIIYRYSEIQEMISNGEFQKITGGATSVDLGWVTLSEGYFYRLHQQQCPEFPYTRAERSVVLLDQVFSVDPWTTLSQK